MPNNAKSTIKGKTRHGTLKTERKPASRSKVDTLVQCLKRPKGVSIATLCNATNWQSHSVRAALSRMQERGHTVVRIHDEGRVTRYRIT